MIVITRYSVPEADTEAFRTDADAAVEVLSQRPGFRCHRIGRAADEPTLWTVVTEWDGAGYYRRALSNFDVKVTAVPLLSRAIDEPTAFEILASGDTSGDAPS
ncbi:MAG: antibiotic biosynthesis monooxygenase [Nocardiopsis sp. BM-2018]|uniref:Quinol monooxygenase YgiN n=1 Tax=Nocardiopsis metallicus TaxID=179819 RepID=A0A840W1G5_9ACTN|nr:antibiotic biosynthesis monooxygenase family protein [Nocardiopsis metallicus]MBB5489113.1 quinol monooxygenase YgiN [Nocardiopsis metallicus]QRN79328.1 MAG: antibiotic biosynthesis monooxygenase [Nocardiopsis sp. BM-2018]